MKNKFMNIAFKESQKSLCSNDFPVGAVIVLNEKIIAKGHNTIEKDQNALSHAELNAIKKATKKLNNWRLIDCDMYVTLEPCEMCTAAIRNSRIKNVYYLTSKNKTKQFISNFEFYNEENLSKENQKMMRKIFQEKRN